MKSAPQESTLTRKHINIHIETQARTHTSTHTHSYRFQLGNDDSHKTCDAFTAKMTTAKKSPCIRVMMDA